MRYFLGVFGLLLLESAGAIELFDLDDLFYTIWNTKSDLRTSGECGSANEDSSYPGVCMSRSDCYYSRGEARYDDRCGFLKTCCVVSRGCNKRSNSKVSYFKFTEADKGNDCKYTIDVMDNVCQLRVDFEQFAFDYPDQTVPSTCQKQYLQLTDSQGELRLCGYNTRQHIYVHLNTKTEFNFEVFSGKNDVNTPSLRMKVTQLFCSSSKYNKDASDDFKWLAPAGCRQYFMNQSGSVRSLGYDGDGSHQTPVNRYALCFKKTDGYCTIRYTKKDDLFIAPDDPPTITNTEEECRNYLYFPGKEYVAGEYWAAKLCIDTDYQMLTGVTSHSPGLFYLFFSNPIGNSKFGFDYQIHSACTL